MYAGPPLFPQVNVCSNLFIGGRVILSISSHPVLQLARGNSPLVWLNAPVPNSRDWVLPLIVENRSHDQRANVVYSNEERTVTIRFSGETILVVTKESEDLAVISQLNLQPVGLAIAGDSGSGLKVGNNLLSHNVFAGVDTLIAIGATLAPDTDSSSSGKQAGAP